MLFGSRDSHLNCIEEAEAATDAESASAPAQAATEETTAPDNGTFFNDEFVEVITLPSTLARIDHTSIAGCPSLRMVVFNGTVEEWESIPKSIYWIDCDVPVKCKDDYAEK